MEERFNCKLGDLFEFEYGKGLTKKQRNEIGNYPVYGSNGIVGFHDEYLIEGPAIIVGRKGAAGEVAFEKKNLWPIDTTYFVKVPEYLDFMFSFFLLKSLVLSQLDKSTAIPGLNRNDAYNLNINLPPLPEQRAIVSKIELLFSELDNGIANIKLAQEQLKVYRQAVLKKAFEGELTKKWREQQTDLPDAGDLLEQIYSEREKAVKATKVKPVKPFTENELILLPKIPKEWCWVRLEDVGNAIDPQPSHRTPPIFENGIPYVGVGDIDKETGEFDYNKARKVSPTVLEEHLERYSIDEGDFIIGKIGTIGKPFLIPIRRFYTLSANVVLIKSNDHYCLKKYMFYLSKSQIVEKQFLQGSKATTQAAFGIQKVRILNIPLCFLPEQQAIVQEIEKRLSVCDKIEQDIKENLEKAEALRQSILKKAFEGKLLNERELAEVRGAEDWESAEVLLERIRAEKTASGKKGRS
ncbi:MAG: restriction endonuclease subunit S [Methanosarcina sp.]|uniref:restriction endonuclease subunit S n=1 Tax=Methanosarcina sp. TaxID=2213 RepID=UPI00260AB0D1|nr:restriction endonuclease subunit S [Methanosarcina sp.]MDD3245677.1 restriction endonuclease subunit S [Methanosarcina sp.]MDD4248206.1 restriction endonuclease subunit S [Methanosarcina sp.]